MSPCQPSLNLSIILQYLPNNRLEQLDTNKTILECNRSCIDSVLYLKTRNKIMSFEHFNPPPSTPVFKPSEDQKKILAQMWDELCERGADSINSRILIRMMSNEGIDQYVRRQIWMLANGENKEYLDKNEVLVLIRLLSYAQRGLRISEECLRSPPKESSVPESDGVPTAEVISSFHNKWLSLEHKSSGLVKGSEIKKRYAKQASKEVLSGIWNICSKTVKGYMTKGETLVFEHFLHLRKQNISMNSLPIQSKRLIEEIDNQNSYKIKNFSTQMEIDKENYERENRPNNHQVDAHIQDLERQVDQSNQVITGLRGEIEQIRGEQTNSINQAVQIIQRLKNVIEVQNAHIRELKTTLEKRGELDYKRAEFVETFEYMVAEQESGFRKKDRMLSSNKEVVETHQEYEYPEMTSSKGSVVRIKTPLQELQEKTLTLILSVQPRTPDQVRVIERRIGGMEFDQLQNYYTTMYNKHFGESNPEIDVSMASTQKLEMIRQVFGNVSLSPEDQL